MAARDGFGSPGIGDPYFPLSGNGGYRIDHYGIHLDYRFATGMLHGVTRIKAHSTQGLTRFDLDFMLNVTKVTVAGVPASFRKGLPGELVVRPRYPIRAGRSFNVTVTYFGKPAKRRFHRYSSWARHQSYVYVIGEPRGLAWWCPGNDHPSDKARYDIFIRSAARFQILSNGSLVSNKVTDGERLVHWRMHEPMASYLPQLAIGHFRDPSRDDLMGSAHRGGGGEPPAGKAARPHLAGTARYSSHSAMAVAPVRAVPVPAGRWGRHPVEVPLRAGTARRPDLWRRTVHRSLGPASALDDRSRECPPNGSATASASAVGRTSGSTRASRRMRSGCGVPISRT